MIGHIFWKLKVFLERNVWGLHHEYYAIRYPFTNNILRVCSRITSRELNACSKTKVLQECVEDNVTETWRMCTHIVPLLSIWRIWRLFGHAYWKQFCPIRVNLVVWALNYSNFTISFVLSRRTRLEDKTWSCSNNFSVLTIVSRISSYPSILRRPTCPTPPQTNVRRRQSWKNRWEWSAGTAVEAWLLTEVVITVRQAALQSKVIPH